MGRIAMCVDVQMGRPYEVKCIRYNDGIFLRYKDVLFVRYTCYQPVPCI